MPTSSSRTPISTRRRHVRELAPDQRRPELHRGQALHRRAARPRAFTRALRRADESEEDGRSADAGTDVGPQARHDLRDALHQQVEASVERGATLLLGGEIPRASGAFYPPTVLTDVKPGHAGVRRGAVRARRRDHRGARRRRCHSHRQRLHFGLGAAVFTKDVARGERIARAARGGLRRSSTTLVASDPRLPFGGIKESRLRTRARRYGIKEFVNAKTVVVK